MSAADEIVPGSPTQADDTLHLDFERIKEVDKGLTVRMSGYLDGFNVGYFQRKITRAIERGYIFLSFDLEKISYISSRGIGTVAALFEILKARGGALYLFGLKPKVLDVLHLLGFQEYFNIGLTAEGAVSVFRESSGASAAVFPVRHACPVCGQAVTAPGPGRGLCPTCRCRLKVDRQGRVLREA